MKSQFQEMAQTTLSDLLDSQNIHLNWSNIHLENFGSPHGLNSTNPTVSPADEIDDLRYSITTSVFLM